MTLSIYVLCINEIKYKMNHHFKIVDSMSRNNVIKGSEITVESIIVVFSNK